MAFGKPKAPKEPKPPKAPKEKKPKKPKKEKPPKAKKGKKGQPVPQEVEGLEGEEQPQKKKLPLPLLIISLAVIVAAAVILFLFVIKPKFFGGDADPDVSVSVEPEPPVLPTEIPIGDDVSIVGMALEADESGALYEKAKTITYTYSNLVDAGKAAQTYVSQLAGESPAFSVVDEEFVRLQDKPDYTAAEGMVLLARNVPLPEPEETEAPETEAPEDEESQDPDASAAPAPTPDPEPEPTPEPITYVHTVRITWSPGVCVVTADEQVGKVTSPPVTSTPAQHAVTQRGAVQILESMDPAQLGLSGISMDEYEVLPSDATETVNDQPCIRMYVYSDNNISSTNEFMGSYLMSIDGEHLYRVDPVSNEIIELDYTPQ